MNAIRAMLVLSLVVAGHVAAQTTRPTSRPSRKPPTTAKSKVQKYIPSTPEQDARAIDLARQFSEDVASKLSLQFTELQTAHFIIFTYWDLREFEFLKTNCEGAYSAVSKQFDIPVKENVFIGKLPVFMFSKRDDFVAYGKHYDDLDVSATMSGYYAARGDGIGRMAMWKPDIERAGSVKLAEQRWAYTLTHEFTHAFLDRYHSSRIICRWINEGLAEVIAQTQFKRPEKRAAMRQMAMRQESYEDLFDDSKMPTFEYYPVMQGMVETLIAKDRKKFLSLIDAIKDGEQPEPAMQRLFGLDNAGLVSAWRVYTRR